jgi:predicted Zn-dependent protease with MMP-like domain
MEEALFRKLVEEEWAKVPPSYLERITNVAVLVEDEPSEEVRKLEGLEGDDTLLGLYLGVPQTVRGEGYGVGMTLPDTITIYRLPTMREAEEVAAEEGIELNEAVRKVVRDTIWHEVGHYFGHDDEHIEGREAEGTNEYKPG